MSNQNSSPRGLTRRNFLKASGAVAGASVLGATAVSLTALAESEPAAEEAEGVFCGVCRSNCGYSCRYNAHVREGKLVKLEVADYSDDDYRGSCLKGLSYMDRIYGDTRIQYPMRRVEGTDRGAGAWERITWDEAIAEIADKFGAVIDQYGPSAVLAEISSGNNGVINGFQGVLSRLAHVVGMTQPASCYDYATGVGINRVLGSGEWFFANEPKSAQDASMIICWGTNPVSTMPQNWRWMRYGIERGAKLTVIDPVKSNTAHKADEWIGIQPGQDGYLALTLSNWLIQNDKVDWDFLKNRSTAAFLVRRDTKTHLRKSAYEEVPVNPQTGAPMDDFYVWDQAVDGPVLASEAVEPVLEGSFTTPDGIAVDTAYTLLKAELEQYTIEEAVRICGVSEEQILSLAEDFASQRAISVCITYGIDHYVNGHLTTWAIAILMALSGNYAKAGAGFLGYWLQLFGGNMMGMWFPEGAVGSPSNLPAGALYEAVEKQEIDGQPYPMKAMISWNSNAVSNFACQNNFFDKILPHIDFWVVVDVEMTDSACYADMVLPACSWYENEDIRVSYNHPYTALQEKAIEPLYESKPDSEIATLLGHALGYGWAFPEEYTFDDWANLWLDADGPKAIGFTLERLRKEKFIRTQGEDGSTYIFGETVPFMSESMRAQLYYENPAPRLLYGQEIPEDVDRERIVYYRAPDEAGADNALAADYPMVLLTEHNRYRTHTQWFGAATLREIDPEPVARINQADAEERNVATDDLIEVFNERGHCVVKARIDGSIPPGIVNIPKGWQRRQYVEGSMQELSNPKMDPYACAFAFYDTRVNFRKW
ncbi:molybdopterin-dependent oxidoreductase [Adlercreutzia equolifaciens]|uniref:molybdopterin-containing oxidoreductase family protein n=1 Tax=Adlercreutzia equolifaciens TaxID=446660 RepID=UPI0023B0D7EA|nr:molybdopterin-dependent oxidoreductase [Adlercreutzia equolifaciens]MDE8702350.1 molybdopterin-dependent oxidoreductase [Adlercreutzia equolifaciens]